MKTRVPKLLDQYDGKSIPPLWFSNNYLPQGEVVILTRPRPKSKSTIFRSWTHDCWTGRYRGYGRNHIGQPLFRTMKNAVRFAESAYKAGFRMKGKP